MYYVVSFVYFDVIADAVCDHLQSIHIPFCKILKPADYKDIRSSPEDVFILFNCLDFANAHPTVVPKNFIACNMEQLRHRPKVVEFLRRAMCVWEYSYENVKLLQANGIASTFLPYLPVEYTLTIPRADTKLYDVIFIGVLNDRRNNILSSLRDRFTLYESNCCWGDNYNHVVAHARTALNIHHFEGHTILEVHRIIPLVLNNVYVISEHSNDDWYDAQFDEVVTWCTPENISEKLNHFLHLPTDEVHRILETRKQRLLQLSMGPYLRTLSIPEKAPYKNIIQQISDSFN